MFRMVKKLQNVKDNIRIWNKGDFGHIFKEKDQAVGMLQEIQDRIQTEGYNDNLKKLESETLSTLHILISREETFWRQRSRIKWLKEGDRNSKFFHLTTLKHRPSNRIIGLTSVRG